ncbi:hypothetical protein BKA64DRAFT_633767 [Cadophora sp. MPI-SDFR-AT-0126]|nr:hypothetical protein BKA64DRAFT_633767 [Leotiomycetes sp. MPI-SDFR-AT-0126]
MARTKRKPGDRASRGPLPKPGSAASMKSLGRAFSKKFTIDDDELDYKMTDLNLKLPRYKEDFDHVFYQIGFIGFLKDLEQLNKNTILPLDVAAAKWKEVIEPIHAEWRFDHICAAENRDRLTQALLSANEENYEAYRMSTLGDENQKAQAAEGDTKAQHMASLENKGETSSTRKPRKRSSRRANKKLKEHGGLGLGTTLTQYSGVQKNSKKARGGLREVEVRKDPIASRLRSKATAPELPPLENDPLLQGVSMPVPSSSVDIAMEL